ALSETEEQDAEEKSEGKAAVGSIIKRVKNDPRERKRKGLGSGFTGTGLQRKKNKKQQDDAVIDLEAIEYIDPTPPQQTPLKRPESLKLWGHCSEEQQKILQEFCEDAMEG
ncbi:hypothetical protein MKX03_001200, partial [Papaver bracteatum]